MKRRTAIQRVGAAMVLGPLNVLAASFPDRPIKLILPFPAGSATDGATRLIANEVQRLLGQPIVVENLAGADGIIAAQAVKRAPADGYTLFVSTNSAHGSNPALYNHLPYDPQKDFEPVAGLIRIPLVLCVRQDFPATDVAGFVKTAQSREAGKSLNYGSGNTSNRVAAELLNSAATLRMVNVPYRGTPQALQDLVAGQIDAMFVDPFSAMGFIQAGQLKVLATLDTVRHPMLPKVPTMAEQGYQDSEVLTWAAVFAPAKTDPAITERLNQAFQQTLAQANTVAAIQKIAMRPMALSPSELRSFVSTEIARWAHLVELAGIPKK